LIEVAPGINIERDILANMDFVPIVDQKKIKEMDVKIFLPEQMKLKELIWHIPLIERITYDENQHILFVNFQGLKFHHESDIMRALGVVENALQMIQKPGLKAMINYDNCIIEEDIINDYINKEKELAEKYGYTIYRYTTSAFLRFKLGKKLEKRKLAPHIFETEEEAKQFLFNSKL